MRRWLLLSLLTLGMPIVRAGFGDYVDPTFNCPAMTTCKHVCVPTVSDCPLEMLCSGNETLCADGSCAADNCESTLESPCENACAPVTCKKVVNDLDSCKNAYKSLYELEAACAEKTEAAELHEYASVPLTWFYIWVVSVSVSIVLWCACNHRTSPMDCSVQTMEVDLTSIESKAVVNATRDMSMAWQVGYKIHPIGLLLYCCTILTLFSFHGLLGWLTIQYYVQQECLVNFKQRFSDDEQILRLFEIVWSMGILWTFLLKWPYSIGTLFLRRCKLSEATHVAVCVNMVIDDVPEANFSISGFRYLQRILLELRSGLERCLTFIFSDLSISGDHRGKVKVWEYCRVRRNPDGSRYFTFKFRRYNFDIQGNRFVTGIWCVGDTVGEICSAASIQGGLSASDVEARRQVVGWNWIDMDKPSYIKCLLREISRPFNSYQSFMVWSWMPLYYWHMALLLSAVILAGALTVSYFKYQSERNLYQIAIISGEVLVYRDGNVITVHERDLVPGDIIHLRPGPAYCDMALVESSSMLVDESALTGEATPVVKLALHPADGKKPYSRTYSKRQTILAGTTISECERSRAIVTHTSSFTARGELLREIFSYNRQKMKFDYEIPIILSILFLYALFGFSMVVYFMEEQPVYGWFFGMYVVAAVLPPLLPTVYTISIGISAERLIRKRIACARADAILLAGKVTRAFFDKTGTLTHQGLDFISTRSVQSWRSTELSKDMALGMAVCHNVTRSQNRELIGNPVDIAMFKNSGGFYHDKDGTVRIISRHGVIVEVIKHFDFDPSRMTQSVLVRMSDNTIIVYVKGSGEAIKKLCKSDTLPQDYDNVLRDSARLGIYQISMAMKVLSSDWSEASRDEVESNLRFVGVINFKNHLKRETPRVIMELEEGDVKAIMVTGDSLLTGISIARECGMIRSRHSVLIGSLDPEGDLVWRNEADESVTVSFEQSRHAIDQLPELAITGEAWKTILETAPPELDQIIDRVRVFGRCTPHDKISVVSTFVERGYVTLMCGDGGNDCGALKTAHVGIALSDAEASVVAPITSLDKDITSVTEVLKEGRCALASALAAYKFLIMYGQIETINQLINAYNQVTFSDWCWIFMDGIWTMSLAFALPLARAADKLSPTRPTASLLGIQTLSSVLGILAMNFAFTVSALAYLWHQDWFQCRRWQPQDFGNPSSIGDNYEAEVVFLVTGYQYISSAMAFNFGYEFRQSWIRNYVFVGLAVFYTTLHFYITLNPSKLSCIWRVNCENENVVGSPIRFAKMPIQNAFNTTVMPEDFCRGLLGMMIANAIIVSAWDYLVVNGLRQYFSAKKRIKS